MAAHRRFFVLILKVYCLENGLADDDPAALQHFESVLQRKVPGLWRRETGANDDDLLYSIPHDITLRSLHCHNVSWLLGVDRASYQVVATLVPTRLDKGINVLDLCCAPGTKSILTAMRCPRGSQITGLDVNPDRLFVARNQVRRFGAENMVSLYLADSTHVACDEHSLEPTPRWTIRDWLRHQNTEHVVIPNAPVLVDDYKVWRRHFINKRVYEDVRNEVKSEEIAPPNQCIRERVYRDGLDRYDRVMVDVECTTDGSAKHVDKLAASKHYEAHYSCDDARAAYMKHLFELQSSLLYTAIEHLKSDINPEFKIGSSPMLIYSTCSRYKEQNECVVEAVLSELLARNNFKLEMIPLTALLPVGSFLDQVVTGTKAADWTTGIHGQGGYVMNGSLFMVAIRKFNNMNVDDI